MTAPNFHQIPFRMLLGAVTGYISAKLAGSSPTVWAKVSVIASLADSILYLGIIEISKQKINRKVTYLFTHAIVSTIEILALRRLDLIAKNGTLIVSAYAIMRCVIISQEQFGEAQDDINTAKRKEIVARQYL